MPTAAKVICTCISQGCSDYTYSDDGVIKHGQRVSHSTRKAHLLFQERNKCTIQSALNNVVYRHPVTQGEASTPAVINQDFLDNLGNLSISPNTQPPVPGEPQDSTSEPNIEDMENLPTYIDCAQFHIDFINKNPVTLLINLKSSLFYVSQQISWSAAAYLLKLDHQLIEVVTSHGLDESSKPRGLTYSERKTLDSFPVDPTTIIRHLEIDPDLSFLVCCPRCFAMYPLLTAPEQCLHTEFPQPCQHTDEFKDQFEDEGDIENHVEEDSSDADDANRPQVCGADLFYEHQSSRKPIRRFAFHDLHSWLARLYSRAGVEDALEATAKKSSLPFNEMEEISDIQESRAWREFLGPNGQQFTSDSGNITFAMFMDGINPYGNRQAGKHASVTFVIMVCLSLPVELRYRPENIFLVGIAPGPKEPSLEQTNWILRPVVEQLKSLWSTGTYLSKTYQYPQGRLIRAALLPFFADLPALRRALGFAGHNARRMCSYCLIDKKDIKNFDTNSWTLRNLTDHRYWANQSREAANPQVKKHILSEHGVRFSVLLELSYWNILECHVVDAMHNLLLGILKWHCQRFWLMSDVNDEDEPRPVSSRELDQLLKDSFKKGNPGTTRPASPSPEEFNEAMPFGEMFFGSDTDPSDADFVLGQDWGGDWIPPSTGKVILDKEALSFINRRLKQLHIPSWIGRAIPVLGKASFGRLKADEWRNLFTIQLPLILPALWQDDDPANQSLLHNFAHLVSFITLALKRTMNMERVNQYRHHLQEYMKSSVLLFPDSPVAPNHHMAFHLADCLDKYGPCRAWWAFSMERLMGTVLKATSNNRLGESITLRHSKCKFVLTLPVTSGQMEITCMSNFYRIGNLRALLDSPNFPPALAPFIRQVKSLYDPIPFAPQTVTKNRINLDKHLFDALTARINELFPLVNQTWVASDKWDKMKSRTAMKFTPLTSHILKIPNCVIDKIVFSSVKTNENNSVVALKPNTHGVNFGIIQLIFQHSRVSPDKSTSTDTWLSITPLIPAPSSVGQHYTQLESYPLGLKLRKIDKSRSHIIHSTEILAHCAWTKYQSQDLSAKNVQRLPEQTDDEYVVLVSLDR
ncbi:hypothetical protein PCASD_17572 [Puccinia coronata f. sp. avenae]|uniref:DUF4218 domain-containing protein n=1 Tax=Puccinia coronata f. sp. avenae TaxID=200324 RepID=A0A2N5U5X3_9BASI|nr:hypothetical protein PCASD_17572 [Puccinia coronata f. sp. avenae]